MGSKSAPTPPPPPAFPEPSFDPAAIMGPMMASMNQMMNSFAQSQQQMFQFLAQSTSAPPDPSQFFTSDFNLEDQRERIRDQLAQNPANQDQAQGASGVRPASPLEEEEDEDVDILNIQPRSAV